MIWIRSSVFLSLLVAGVLTFAAQERPQVRLRETAEVHGQTIRLSDLLPADASLELREVAAAADRALRVSEWRLRRDENSPCQFRFQLTGSRQLRRRRWLNRIP